MRNAIMGIALAASLLAAKPAVAEDAEVTVLAILGTDRNQEISAKLKDIAVEVRKTEPKMTGFSIYRTTKEPLNLNKKLSVELLDNLSAEITLLAREDNDKKVKLTVKAPHAGEVTYTTVGEKYFTLVTRYQNSDKDRLILAIMVKPMPAKPMKKDSQKEKDGQKK